jgi:hypothetical protein
MGYDFEIVFSCYTKYFIHATGLASKMNRPDCLGVRDYFFFNQPLIDIERVPPAVNKHWPDVKTENYLRRCCKRHGRGYYFIIWAQPDRSQSQVQLRIAGIDGCCILGADIIFKLLFKLREHIS